MDLCCCFVPRVQRPQPVTSAPVPTGSVFPGPGCPPQTPPPLVVSARHGEGTLGSKMLDGAGVFTFSGCSGNRSPV